jgi:hypothetical protein
MKKTLKRLVTAIVISQTMAIPIAGAFAASSDDSALNQSATGANKAVETNAAASQPAFQKTPYFTDSYGNILMNVNIWGNVLHGGAMVVPEGADVATAISLAGGPVNEANLEKVRVNRAQPDRNGKTTYVVNMKNYAKHGDRTGLLELQPNDTIIVPQSKSLDILGILGVGAAAATIYSLTK